MASIFNKIARNFTSSALVAGVVTNGTGGAAAVSGNQEVAIYAAGCFWGVEHLYRQHFGNGKGLLNAEVGYIGGTKDNPSYRQVCSGTTEHAEALKVTFDPSKVSYEKLTDFFYSMHDATTLNRQGGDRGTQYRSAVFYTTDEQKRVAEKVQADVQETHYKGNPIVTQIMDGRTAKWWSAEDYHQQYLHHTPGGYECPAHYLRWQ